MQLLKPSWVNHDDGQAIFSVDIHPDGSRFATGGQGQGQDASGRVVIWNMKPVLYEKFEQDTNCPKLLCQLDQHLGCVNCVRWSQSGRYLASAGDDKVIIIWQLSNYGGGSVFGSNVVNVEWWRCVSTLRGHDGDILDVAWAPRDTFLASVSVDNTVIIWNGEKWPERVRVLRGHRGLVKGVTWDPVGRYLASQADDKTLIVWRTADWSQETAITKPFQECGGTTSVLRLSWSPDGQYLVSAHATNNGGPTAQIIDRDHWTTDKDFVGHRKPITCVRFNPNILKKTDGTSKKPVQYCCLAVGSRDRSLSIWFTSLKRPLLVIHDVFEDSVLDLSFSACGRHLLAVSKDGTLACISFSAQEMGHALTKEEADGVYMKLYGERSIGAALQASPAAIIDNPEVLKARRLAQSAQQRPAVPAAPANNGPVAAAAAAAPLQRGPDKQIERRTVDGRRRITPVFIPPSADGANLSFESFSTSRTEKSKIVIEKLDGVVEPNVTPLKKRPQADSASNSSPVKVPMAPLGDDCSTPVAGSQRPAILPELNGVNPGITARLERQDKSSEQPMLEPTPAPSAPVKRKLDEPQPIAVKRKRGRPPLDRSLHNANNSPAVSAAAAAASVAPAAAVAAPPASAAASTPAAPAAPATAAAATAPSAPLTAAPTAHILPEASLGKSHKIQVNNDGGVVVVENDWKSLGASNGVHRVSRVREGVVLWTSYATVRISAVAVGSTCVALACANSSLQLLCLKTGGDLAPSVQLAGKCAKMCMMKDYLLLLTTSARVALWHTTRRKCLLSECVRHLFESRAGSEGIRSLHLLETETDRAPDKSTAPAPESDPAAENKESPSDLCNGHMENSLNKKAVTNCTSSTVDGQPSQATEKDQRSTKSDSGSVSGAQPSASQNNDQIRCIPVLVLGSGEVFARCWALESWIQLGESPAVQRLVISQYCCLPPSTSPQTEPPLARILNYTNAYAGSGRSLTESSSNSEVKVVVTESFLKKMLTSSAYLSSARDFQFWYSRLVTFYIKQGRERELRNVFEELMAPPSSCNDGPVTTVLPTHRALLGKDTVSLVRRYLQELLLLDAGGRLQRLYTEFKELVDSSLVDPEIMI